MDVWSVPGLAVNNKQFRLDFCVKCHRNKILCFDINLRLIFFSISGSNILIGGADYVISLYIKLLLIHMSRFYSCFNI